MTDTPIKLGCEHDIRVSRGVGAGSFIRNCGELNCSWYEVFRPKEFNFDSEKPEGSLKGKVKLCGKHKKLIEKQGFTVRKLDPYERPTTI